jgi:predicted GIY-YIG superfamily endonuclease
MNNTLMPRVARLNINTTCSKVGTIAPKISTNTLVPNNDTVSPTNGIIVSPSLRSGKINIGNKPDLITVQKINDISTLVVPKIYHGYVADMYNVNAGPNTMTSNVTVKKKTRKQPKRQKLTKLSESLYADKKLNEKLFEGGNVPTIYKKKRNHVTAKENTPMPYNINCLKQWVNRDLSPDAIESISPHLCYVLYSTVTNRIYIGYTNDFPHRIRQHNGEILGGAKKTHRFRPWKKLCSVHGFYDNSSALRFEWRLQHPGIRRKKGENTINFAEKSLRKVILAGDGSQIKDNKMHWPPLLINWALPGYNVDLPNVFNQQKP